MDDDKVRKAAESMFEIICGGLIGIDIIAIIQMIGLPPLDSGLTLALYCFAISLPLLALFVFFVQIERTRKCSIDIWYKYLFLAVGIVCAPLGVGLLILHLSQTAAYVFGFLCFGGVVFTGLHIAIADYRGKSRKR